LQRILSGYFIRENNRCPETEFSTKQKPGSFFSLHGRKICDQLLNSLQEKIQGPRRGLSKKCSLLGLTSGFLSILLFTNIDKKSQIFYWVDLFMKIFTSTVMCRSGISSGFLKKIFFLTLLSISLLNFHIKN
jgi:hypothetical protein